MSRHLAIDAGGTSTRAVHTTSLGECLGYGTSGGGNPVSRGFDAAADALLEASRMALGGMPGTLDSVTVCMAGASLGMPTQLLRERFLPLGLRGPLVIEADLLATFYSGTFHDDGYALVAGTGAVAARIEDGRLAAVSDGAGWLIGDDGAGFWLGREVVRAVAAALDGRGPATVLTAGVLADLDITGPGTPAGSPVRRDGRLVAQQELIARIYELAPIELSRFAPLVFAAQGDPVAADIASRAAAALAVTIGAVMAADRPGPLVFGGSVLTKAGRLAGAVTADLVAGGHAADVVGSPVLVADGAAGAAVLALKRAGVVVGVEVFARVSDTLARLRGDCTANPEVPANPAGPENPATAGGGV